MDAVTVLVGLGAAIVGVAAGLVYGRRSRRDELSSARGEVSAADEALARAERTAREDRRSHDLILGTMQEGVLLMDRDGRFTFANEAAERHLGSRPAGLAQLFPLPAREAVAGAAAEGTSRTVEVEVGAPPRWLRVAATAAGEDGSVLVVVTDVTEPRRLDAVRRDFVANASHELKTPAASIQAAAETLRDAAEGDPAAVPRFAAQLEHDALRLSRIVMDLLDLSRLETGADAGEHLRLDRLIREEVERAAPMAEESRVALHADSDEAVEVVASQRDLALLVRNLVDNAIRYTQSGGQVVVGVRSQGADAVLVVADNGIGIPSRDVPRIFERFYRVDRARSRETGGTGLGLAIVKHVAENLGARIDVESELGAGTTFTVRLPRAA